MIGKSLFWEILSKLFKQSTGLIISIFLTRILLPEDFGLIGMVLVIIGVLKVFIDMGFGAALIQKKKVTQNLFSTVFWVNVSFGLLFSLLMYCSAGLISDFYNRPSLENIVEVISITFFIGSLSIVQTLKFTKEMNFKAHSIISMISSLFSGGIGLFLAYTGYHVWALVYQNILLVTISTACYWAYGRWLPSFHFSIKDLKEIWGFSSKKLSDGIISAIYQRLDIIMIGKAFDATSLGFYSRARTLDNYVRAYSADTLARIYFPVISKIQDNPNEVIKIYRKAIIYSSFVAILLSGLLFLIADELFVILFTETWLYSANLFKLMAVVGFSYPLSAIMVNVVIGMGFPGKNLVLGLWKKTFGIIALVIGFFFGIEKYLHALVAVNIIGLGLNLYFVSNIIKIDILSQLKLFYKTLAIGVFLVLIVNTTNIENNLISLIFKVICYSSLFIFIIYKTDMDTKTLIKGKLGEILIHFRKKTSEK